MPVLAAAAGAQRNIRFLPSFRRVSEQCAAGDQEGNPVQDFARSEQGCSHAREAARPVSSPLPE